MRIFSATMALIASLYASNTLAGYEAVAGDIIFQTSLSTQSIAVQKATDSPYSHMGLIFLRAGKPYVLEAVQPVKYTALAQWQARGKNSHYVIKRMKAPLSAEQQKQLQAEAEKFINKPYDLTFEWSDRRIYCSELVWKAYQRSIGIKVGQLQKLRDFHLDDPAVRKKIQERYGRSTPLDETVISPTAIYDYEQLVTVAEE